MKAKNKKTTLILSAASVTLLITGVILIEISKTEFNLHDFLRGLFAGMGSVTFVVWLIYFVKNIGKKYSADGSVIFSKDKNAFLAITMMMLLTASIAADYFSKNMFVSAACFVTVASSYVLNFVYVKKRRSGFSNEEFKMKNFEC